MDREVVEQKLESLRRCLHRIEAKCPTDAGALAVDFAAFSQVIAMRLEK